MVNPSLCKDRISRLSAMLLDLHSHYYSGITDPAQVTFTGINLNYGSKNSCASVAEWSVSLTLWSSLFLQDASDGGTCLLLLLPILLESLGCSPKLSSIAGY